MVMLLMIYARPSAAAQWVTFFFLFTDITLIVIQIEILRQLPYSYQNTSSLFVQSVIYHLVHTYYSTL